MTVAKAARGPGIHKQRGQQEGQKMVTIDQRKKEELKASKMVRNG